MDLKKLVKNPFLWAFVLGIISLHLFRELSNWRKSAPPPIAIVPDWHLIDQNGQPFGQKDLKGKVVVADFFFTSCPSICPMLTTAMKEVYERFRHRQDVYFLSITVDPDIDTPKVLKLYMEKNDIDYDNWRALTGTKAEIYDLIVNKLHVHVGDKKEIEGKEGMYDISHMAQLALFDQKGDLRGLFRTDSVELSALVRAVKLFLGE